MNHNELKAIQNQLGKLEADYSILQANQREASKAVDACSKKIKALKDKIKDMTEKSAEPVLSEHALLRFIERVYGLDMEEIKSKILTPTTVNIAKNVKSGSFPLECGGRAVIKNNVIVSIYES